MSATAAPAAAPYAIDFHGLVWTYLSVTWAASLAAPRTRVPASASLTLAWLTVRSTRWRTASTAAPPSSPSVFSSSSACATMRLSSITVDSALRAPFSKFFAWAVMYLLQILDDRVMLFPLTLRRAAWRHCQAMHAILGQPHTYPCGLPLTRAHC